MGKVAKGPVWWASLLLWMIFSLLSSACADSYTVAVSTAPATVTVAVNGSTSTTTTMTAHTAWDNPGNSDFNATTCIYMTGPLVGSPGNTDTVPYSSIQVTPTVGGTVPMVNQSSCRGAGALVIGTSFATHNNGSNPATRTKNGYRDDTVNLQVVNVGSISPDTYTGTIFVSASWY